MLTFWSVSDVHEHLLTEQQHPRHVLAIYNACIVHGISCIDVSPVGEGQGPTEGI